EGGRVGAGGWVGRVPRAPGGPEQGVGSKTIDGAIHPRTDVLARLEAAAEASAPARRRALLTFVVVAAGTPASRRSPSSRTSAAPPSSGTRSCGASTPAGC